MSEQSSAERGDRLRKRVAREIRVVLARQDISQAELARRIGQDPRLLSRRMTGAVAFDLDDLEVIAQVLDIDVASLFRGAAPIAPFIPQPRRAELVA